MYLWQQIIALPSSIKVRPLMDGCSLRANEPNHVLVCCLVILVLCSEVNHMGHELQNREYPALSVYITSAQLHIYIHTFSDRTLLSIIYTLINFIQLGCGYGWYKYSLADG